MSKKKQRPIAEALERRLLYSADPINAFFDFSVSDSSDDAAPFLLDTAERVNPLNTDKHLSPQNLVTNPSEQQTPYSELSGLDHPTSEKITTGRLELVFVDTNTPDYQQLLDDILSQIDPSRSFEIVILDASTDGVDTIGETLGNYKDIDAIHIISHGSDGILELGNNQLDLSYLLREKAQFELWKSAFSEEADILLYGCDLASSLAGERFIDTLSLLTGADVTASDDLTGHANLGGDYDFEYFTGAVEARTVFTTAMQDRWVNTLDITSNLAAHLEFEENGGTTAFDSTPNNNDGTWTFAPQSDAGVVGSYALDFAGDTPNSNRVIDVADDVSLDFSGDFSIAFWYNSSVAQADNTRIIGSHDGNDGFSIFADSDGSLNFFVQGSTNAFFQTETAGLVADGNWHHVVATVTTGSLRLYVDNASSGSGGGTLGTVDPSAPLTIGGESTTVSDYEGKLDDIRVYTRALTTGDVNELYALGDVTGQPAGYPFSNGSDNTLEWITNVTYAGINNTTGAEAGGYSNNTSTDIATVTQSDSNDLTITIQFDTSAGTSPEHVKAWIDWNQDGDFLDAGEEVYAATTLDNTPGTITVNTPASALVGATVMRVSMNWNQDPVSDATLAYGEVEDYSVTVLSSGGPQTFTVVNTNDSGIGSLRQAILDANANAGFADTIEFNIPGSGTQIIALSSALDAITSQVTIDGTTQTGWVEGSFLPIVLDGIDGVFDGLNFTANADGSLVRGLVIRDFSDAAIEIVDESDNITVVGNWIGQFNSDGTNSGDANGNWLGVRTYGDNTTIGGTTAADRNVFAGNDYGVIVRGTSTGTSVSGNYIGTDTAGNSLLGSTDYGLYVQETVTNLTIGGTTTAHGNVIAGVSGNAIRFDQETVDGNTIQFNKIGVSADGTSNLGNSGAGILITNGSDNNQILDNVIAGSSQAGIELRGSTTDNVMKGNIIGTDASVTQNWGNGEFGIVLSNNADNNTIGSIAAGEGNTIAFNGHNTLPFDSGISVQDTSTGNTIRGNSIYSNVGVGIDLSASGDDGADTNDAADADTGGNNKQNWAVLSTASIADDGTFTYNLDTTTLTSGTYTVDFYASSDRDSGQVEGKRYFGSLVGVGDGASSVTGTISGVTLATGEYVTLVTTGASGNSSEFSNYMVAADSDFGGTSPNEISATNTSNGGLSLNEDGGNDAYLVADDANAIVGGLTNLTIETQFSLSGGAAFSPLLSYDTGAGSNDLLLYVNSSGKIFFWIDDTSVSTSSAFNQLFDGDKHSVAVTWSDSGASAIYVDGVLAQVFTGHSTGASISNSGELVFAQEQDSLEGGFQASQVFKGALYDVRIFDDVRSSEEIASSHRSSLPYDEPGMLANWRFDSLSNDGVVTDTVNGNNIKLKHTSESGFSASDAELTFSLYEKPLNGTVVGQVSGIDADREALIASLLAGDPSLKYNSSTDKFYKLTSATDVDWTTAQSTASSTNLNGITSQLVTIRSAHEQAIVQDYAADATEIWLGATDATVEGEWRWLDGGIETDEFWAGDGAGYAKGYNNWAPTQPNDGSGTNNQIALNVSDGKWADRGTSAGETNAVLVEWNADDVLDVDQAQTYTLNAQTVAGAFEIDASTGKITVADGSLLDYESNATHSLTVRTTDVDGNIYDDTFDILLNNLTEANNTTTNLSSGIELNTDGGNDAYLIASDGGEILGGLSSLTFETLVNISGPNAATLISYATASSANSFYVEVTNSGEIYVGLNSASAIFSESNYFDLLANGELHQIAVSWDNTSGDISVYINGELKESKTGISAGQVLNGGAGDGTLIFGQEQDSVAGGFQSNQAFEGTIYDARIWDEVRSAAEIALNYQSKFDNGTLPDGLIANWQMDGFDGSGEVVNIVSSNNLSVGKVGDIRNWSNQVGGVTATGNTLTYVDNGSPENWGSQINSANMSALGFIDDYTIRFTLDNTTNFAWSVGLSATESSASNADIEYAIFVDYTGDPNDVSIMHNGTSVGTFDINFAPGGEFGFYVNGTTLEYQYDGMTFASDTITASTDWYIDTSFYFRTSDGTYNNQDDYSLSNFHVVDGTGGAAVGFTGSIPVEDLHISENANNGDSVGFVVPSDPDGPGDIVSDGLFAEANARQYIGDTFGGWTVTAGEVDPNNQRLSPLGGNYVELNGAGVPGTIAQDLNTEAGRQYQVVFAFSGDFRSQDTVKDLRVAVDGQSHDFAVSEPAGWTVTDPVWDTRSFTFTAEDSTPQLSFASLDAIDYGPWVADIQVIEIPQAISTILNNDPTLSYDAATGKFYRLIESSQQFEIAKTNASQADINGVNGQLVTIRSQYENELVRSMMNGADIWIGALDTNFDGDWGWIDDGVEGDAFWTGGVSGSATAGSYANWNSSNEPNSGDYSAAMQSSGTWYDHAETATHHYVIEWDANEVLSSFTFNLTDDAGGRFAIDSSTGEITVAATNTLDHESATSHDVDVTVTDAAGNSYVETMTITVDNGLDAMQTVPVDQTIDEDTTLTFTAGTATEVSVTDTLAGTDTPMQVSLSVSDGVLILSQTTGITFAEGVHGNSSFVIYGTESAINAALDGMTFQPDAEFSGSVTLTMTTELAADLVGHYTFENAVGADDQSAGSSQNGTLSDNATIFTDSDHGDVLSLDGNGDYVQITGLFDEPEDVTLSAWINRSDSSSLDEVISLGDNIGIRATSAGLTLFYYTASGSHFVTLSEPLSDGWHYVAATFDDANDTVTLYLNGEAVVTEAESEAIVYNRGSNTFIGRHGNGVTVFDFGGLIDDARIYSRALSSEEIAALATDQTPVTDTVAITVNVENDAPTFGVGPGISNENFAGASANEFAEDIIALADGSTITAGNIFVNGSRAWAIAKWLPDGSLDTSFGTDGVYINEFGAGNDLAKSIVEQADGKLVIGGYVQNTDRDFAVMRLNADGSVDSDFGASGVVYADFGTSDVGNDIAIQSDGDILITGASNADTDIRVVRLNGADGSFDNGFGVNGIATIDLGGSEDATSIAVDGFGRIILGGFRDADAFVARLTSTGSLDTSFGNPNGYATTGLGGTGISDVGQVIVQIDSSYVLVGSSFDYSFPYGQNEAIGIARFTSAGILDSGFGDDGVVRQLVNGSNIYNYGHDVAQQSDGKLIVVGTATPTSQGESVVFRYNTDGTLDTSFGDNGIAIAPSGFNWSETYGVDIASDSTILVAGYGSYGGSSDYDTTVWRYDSTGTLIAGEGSGRLNDSPTFVEDGTAVVLDSDVFVFDRELSSAENFNGSSLTFTRNGGANNEDIFSTTDLLSPLVESGNLIYDGTTIGTVTTNSGGSLVLSFNSSATNTLVNETSRSIVYSNSSNSPPSTVQIDWTFDDGGNSVQTQGGAAEQVNGSTIVNITTTNDAPVIYATNLLLNGDFDTGDLTGWSTTGTALNSGNSLRFGSSDSAAPHTASQSFTTVIGQIYTLEFEYRDDNSSSSQSMQVTVDSATNNLDQTQTTSTAGTSYFSYTYTFTADSATSTLTFTDTSASSVSVDGFINNISVTEAPTFAAVTEDDVNNSGNTVASILASVSGDLVTDTDAGAVEGIAVTNASSAFDYSLDGGTTWQRVDNVWTFNALLLRSTDLIRLVPNEVASQSETIEFRAWDQTAGTAGTYATTFFNGGSTEFSEIIETASIVTTDVNDAPQFGSESGFAVGYGEPGYNQNVASLALSDGSVLFTPYDSSFNTVIGKLGPDGQLDTSFGDDGYFETSSLTYIRDIKEQADGKFLVTGDVGSDIGLARYNADGTLDLGFGGSGTGVVVTDISGTDEAFEVAVHTDGSIVVVGRAGSDSFVALYTSAGVLDTNFDTDGIAIVNLNTGGNDLSASVTILSDGRVLIAGEDHIARLTTTGGLDGTFGTGGILNVGHNAFSMVVQADGDLAVAGFSGDNIVVSRFDADGNIDMGFGNSGTATFTDPFVLSAYSNKIIQQPDGKLLVVGTAETNSAFGYEIVVVRFNTNGTLDTTFDGDGAWLSGLTNDYGEGYGISLYDDGGTEKIVVGGYTAQFGFARATIARLNPDGSLDSTYQSGLLDGNPTYIEDGAAVVLDGNVQIFDADLNNNFDYVDDFGGSSLTLERNGGANSDDVFSATGNLVFNAGTLELDSTNVGTYTNTGGTLTLAFSAGVSNAQVNEVMQSFQYSNSNNTPPANVEIDWTFDDGNVTDQGSGGNLTTTGSTTVNITATNDSVVAVPDTATGLEAGGAANTTSGTDPTGNVLSNDTDVDTGDTKAIVGVQAGTQASTSGSVATGVAGSHGSITINSDGSYTYTVDNNDAAVQGLQSASDTLTDTFSYTVQDSGGAESTTQITITVQGANDVPQAIVPVTYLSDLTPTAIDNLGLKNDESQVGGTLVFDGVSYPKAISTHAPNGVGAVGYVDYTIDGANAFKSTIGISDNQGNFTFGSVIFRVYVDNVLTYTSPTMSSVTAPIDIDIDTSGATTLRLEVDNANNSNNSDHSAWANARFEGGTVGLSIDETSSNGAVVGSVSRNDVDWGDNATYTMIDDAGGRFAIDSDTGEVTVADTSKLDHEVFDSHIITVRATDIDGASYDDDLVVGITDVNEAPLAVYTSTAPITIANHNFDDATLSEDQNNASVPSWTVIGNAGHWNPTTSHFTSGDGTDGTNIAFVNPGGSLNQTLASNFDSNFDYELKVDVSNRLTYDNGSEYQVRLYAGSTVIGEYLSSSGDDGTWGTLHLFVDGSNFSSEDGQALSIELAHVSGQQVNFDDVRLTSYSTAGVTVNENAIDGTSIVTATGIDPDSGAALTYSLTNNASGRFAIDNSTGVITVANGSLLNFESATSHDIVVEVSDGSNTASENITINLQDMSEPAQSIPGAQSVNEDEVLTFNTTNNNLVSVSDSFAGADTPLQVALSANDGVLALNPAALANITIVEGANGNGNITFNGTESEINAALDGMTFTPDADFNGSVTLNMTTALAVDLVGHYTFEGGNANDQAAGNAENGTFQQQATTVVDAQRGEVLSLDGNNDSVQITGMYGNPASVTLAAWVDLTSPDASGADVISLGDNIALRLDASGSSGAGITLSFFNGSSWEQIRSSVNVTGTGWNHVAATFDDVNNTQMIYLNGQLIASGTSTNSISYSLGANTFIGEHGNLSVNMEVNGLIDDARIYTRAISTDEVAALATEQAKMSDSIAITVAPVNDAPVVTAPGSAFGYTEQGSLNIHGAGFSLADIDDNAGNFTANFSVGEGRVLIDAGDSGVTVISGDRFTSGNSTDTVTFSGTKAQLNALLSGTSTGTIIYHHDQTTDSDVPSASTIIALTINDQGNSGSDPGNSADGSSEEHSASQTINIIAVNDGPRFVGSELVANGDFTTNLSGWSTTGQVSLSSSAVRFGSGNVPGPHSLSQSIATTAGETYTLEFDYKDDGGWNQQLQVSVDGSSNLLTTEQILTDTDGTTFVRYRYSFIADSASAMLTFNDTSDDAGSQSAWSGGVDGYLDNISVRQSNGILNSVGFTEDGSAVTLSSGIEVADAELSNADDFEGATVTLSRNGGSNPEDVFSSTGNLVFNENEGTLELSLSSIATYSDSNGELAITFDAGVTEAQVNETLQSIQYSNTSDAPPASVQIDWVFADGNTTAEQGSGGELSAVSSTTVNITGTNDAPLFGIGDGIVTTVLGPSTDVGASVLVQPDGKALVAGYHYNGSKFVFALTRYNTDGSLDTAFDDDGIVLTSFGVGSDIGSSVAIQADGKIIVGGSSNNGTDYEFALARYNTDGSLDTTFGGGDGIVTTPVGTGNDRGMSIAIQADGHIVIGGYSSNGSNDDFALLRYDINGDLDSTFGGGDGIVTTAIGTGRDRAESVTLQTDGKILLSGLIHNGSDYDLALTRYLSNGDLDTTFGGGDGIVTTAIGSGDDEANSVTVQADGKILVGGSSNNGTDDDFTLVRYNTDGTLDTSFGGGDGIVTTPIGSDQDIGYDVVVLTDGKILIAGSSFNGSYRDFALAQYDSGGVLDSSFGTNGIVTTPVGSSSDFAYDIALQSDGKILLSGYSNNSSSGLDFALVRYKPDGSLDTLFDSVGELDGNPTFVEGGSAVTLDADVGIFDSELSDIDDFDGATLTLTRSAISSSDDVFSATGSLSFAGSTTGNIELSPAGVIGTYSNTGGTLALFFGASVSNDQVNEVMRSIAYSNLSKNPPASVQIEWTFDDGNTGSQGTGGALNVLGSTTVNITAINDAPVATGNTVSTTEDVALVIGPSDFSFSDVEGDSLASVTITGLNLNGGTLTHSAGAVAVTNGTTVTAAELADLTFTSALNDSTDSSFTYTVNDVDTGVTSALMNITVNAVNDVPVATGNAVTADEDVPLVIPASDFNFTDIESDSLTSVTISGLALNGGTLTHSAGSVTVSNGMTITAAELADLTFTSLLNDSTNSSFSYTVNDADAGVTSAVMNITVNAVNDVPVAIGNNIVASEDVPLVIDASDFVFSDIESDSLVSVTITSLNINGGTLTHSAGAVVVTDGMTVSAADLADLTFTSANNDSSNSNFTYTVNDADVGVTSALMNITVSAVNDVPVPTGNTFVADEDVPLVIDAANFLFTDVEGDALTSVTINGLNLNGGTLTHSAGTVTVTNGMTITAAELADLTFTSLLNDSTDSSFSYTVNDVDAGVTSAVMNITVNAVNDVPVAIGNTIMASEDVPRVIDASDFIFSDIESDALASVTITGLTLNGGTLTHSAGTVSVTDGMTVSDAELADLTFTSATNDSTDSNFTYTVNDSDAGVSSALMNITVNAVNDAPVLDISYTLVLNPELEDAGPPSGAVGTSINSLVSDVVNVSDADAASVEGVAIIDTDTNHGQWWFSTDAGSNWNALGSVAETSARLLSADNNTFIYFQPNPDYNGTVSDTISFRAWDRSTGTNGSLQDTSTNGGTTSYSTEIETASISITAVNDVPVATGNTVVADEDVPLVIGLSDFSFTDIESDSLASVTITGLSLNGGTLSHSAGTVTVTNGMTVTAAELADLTFTSALNDSTNSSFSYTVNDADTGVTSAAMNITVNAVNDVPVAMGNAVVATEDEPLLINPGEFLYSDIEGDALTSITVSNLLLNSGSLTHTAGSVVVTDGMQIFAAQLLDLTFNPGLNSNLPASFDYSVNDADNGIVAATLNISVIPRNDAPEIISNGGGDTANVQAEENQEQVAFVVATDPDIGNTVDYAIDGGIDANFFSIDSVTGELIFVNAPNFEDAQDANRDNQYEVEVTASDAFSGVDRQALSVSVTNQNESPFDLNLSRLQIDEHINTTGGFVLGQLSALDEDLIDTLSYSLVGGADVALFSITGDESDTLMIDDGVINFNLQASYELVVRVTDANGASVDRLFNIAVAPHEIFTPPVVEVVEPPPVTEPLTEVEVAGETLETKLHIDEKPRPKEAIAKPKIEESQQQAIDSILAPIEINELELISAELNSQQIQGAAPSPDHEALVPLKLIDLTNLSLMQLDVPPPTAGALSALQNEPFIEELKRLTEELESALKKDEQQYQLMTEITSGVTIGLTAGLMSWMLKSGSLLASFMSAVPAWRHMDPLPILNASKRQPEELPEESQEEKRVSTMFE